MKEKKYGPLAGLMLDRLDGADGALDFIDGSGGRDVLEWVGASKSRRQKRPDYLVRRLLSALDRRGRLDERFFEQLRGRLGDDAALAGEVEQMADGFGVTLPPAGTQPRVELVIQPPPAAPGRPRRALRHAESDAGAIDATEGGVEFGADELQRLVTAVASVVRVRVRFASGDTSATGVLVSPGLVLTAHYAVTAPGDGAHIVVEFDVDGPGAAGRSVPVQDILWGRTDGAALLRLAQPVERALATLADEPPTLTSRLTMVHHAMGGSKQIALRTQTP